MRRTFTDYVMVKPRYEIVPFSEYDVLIKYGAKIVPHALNLMNQKKYDKKNEIVKRLENMIDFIKSFKKPSKKRDECVIRLKEKIRYITDGNSSDERITRVVEEATSDCPKYYS